MAGATVAMAVNTNHTVAYDLSGMTLVGVHVPTGFNGGTLSLYTCLTVDGTYYACQDGAGTTYSVTVGGTPPCYVPMDPVKTKGVRYVELISNTNANANFNLVLAVQGV